MPDVLSFITIPFLNNPQPLNLMSPKDYTKLTTDELAVERTRLAGERTAMAVTRTRMANRRTFLAWCRTALSVMAFGFFLERIDTFMHLQDVPDPMKRDLSSLGIAAFIMGPLMTIFAAYRYVVRERELGFRKSELFVIPELVLFVVIIGLALYYAFS